MPSQSSEQCATICRIYQRAVAAGEDKSDVVGELSAQYGVQRPAIWRALRRGGLLADYVKRVTKQPEHKAKPVLLTTQEKRDALEARPRVESEPCFLCGVRPDVSCRHKRAYE
jgi:hypothetical protein